MRPLGRRADCRAASEVAPVAIETGGKVGAHDVAAPQLAQARLAVRVGGVLTEEDQGMRGGGAVLAQQAFDLRVDLTLDGAGAQFGEHPRQRLFDQLARGADLRNLEIVLPPPQRGNEVTGRNDVEPVLSQRRRPTLTVLLLTTCWLAALVLFLIIVPVALWRLKRG